jgi:release factor glutamine methyltransferase
VNPGDLGGPAAAGARSAIADLGALLRTRGYDLAAGVDAITRVPLFAFALAAPIEVGEARRHVGSELLDRLIDHGVATAADGHAVLGFGVFAAGETYAVVPPQERDGERVYLGADVGDVIGATWRRAVGGDRAADLGTGTGFLAAALARRYRLVVATDLMSRCASTAALTALLNPDVQRRIAVVQADVAGPLREGSFDFVVANPPWVANTELDETGQPCVYADGGPTGFELPRRFLMEGAALLAPGGVAVVCCLELAHEDGRRPLAGAVRALEALGFQVEVEPTAVNDRSGFVERHRARQPGLTSLRHVAVVVRRPE